METPGYLPLMRVPITCPNVREAVAPVGFTIHDKQLLLNNTEAWQDEEMLRKIEESNLIRRLWLSILFFATHLVS